MFGDYFDIYIGLLCTHYGLYKTDKDIPKYVKMHIDDGLELIDKEVTESSKVDGFEYVTNKIGSVLKQIK